MQIFIPAVMFQHKVENEINQHLKTLHITKEYVVFTNSKIIAKVYCNNSQLECNEINLDFYELKNLLKVGSKKSGEISIHANLKEREAEIIYKGNKGIIKGIITRYEKFLDYKKLYDDSKFTYKVKLSGDFSKLALFDIKAKKVIEFKDHFIIAKIGNARIAKQSENLENTELNGLKIALQTSKNSMITLDTNKPATWYFQNATTPYRIIQHDLENTIDMVEIPIIM